MYRVLPVPMDVKKCGLINRTAFAANMRTTEGKKVKQTIKGQASLKNATCDRRRPPNIC